MMLSRLSVVAAVTAVGASASERMFKVEAASAAVSKDDKQKSSSSSAPSKKKQIRACELPIYEEPAPAQFEIIPVKHNAYYQAISDARKWLWTYRESVKDTTKQVTDVYDSAKKYSLDGLQYLQKDSGTLPRAVFISVSGLVGIIFAYRGRFIRKTLYASVAMAGAASLCYPDQARDISTRGWKAARGILITAYKDLNGMPSSERLEKTKAPAPAEPKKDKAAEHKPSEVKSAPSDDKVKKDFGMSHPEDKDMYSTRGK